MKKTVLSLLLLSAVLLSAVQPGLASSDVKFIKEFRLPAWKTMYFNLNLYGGASNKAISNKDYEEGQSSFNRTSGLSLNFMPEIEYMSESENKITDLTCGLDSRIHYNSSKNKEYSPQMDIARYVKLKPVVTFSNKYYQTKGDFIKIGGSLSYDYDYSYRDKNSEVIDRNANIEAIVGYGNGKVRNVTPVIRALRFNKRFRSLGKGQFTDREIGEIAKLVSKRSVYYNTFDEGSKYFWDEMYKAANGKMEGLSGYETFMVMNGLNDLSGNRLEGSELSANARYIWLDQNYNGPGYSQNENKEERYGIFAPYLLGRYYSNLSIDYQVGFEAEGSYQIPTSEKELFEQYYFVRLNHNELYCITDRFLYLGNVSFLYRDLKTDKDDTEVRYEASFRNDFTYYLEDNISLNLGADLVWNKSEFVDKDSEIDRSSENLLWSLSFSLNYRFRTM